MEVDKLSLINGMIAFEIPVSSGLSGAPLWFKDPITSYCGIIGVFISSSSENAT